MIVFRVKYKYLFYIVSGILLLSLLCWGVFGLFDLNQPAYGDVNYSFAVSGIPESTKQLAIVLEDMGDGRQGIEEALALDGDITLAVLPFCEYSSTDAQAAVNAKKEVILHLPMEAVDEKAEKSSYKSLTADMNTQAIEEYITSAIASVPGATGAGDHQGETVCNNMSAMRTVLTQLKSNKFGYYLDSRTVSSSAPQLLCRDLGLQYAQRNVNIDGKKNEGYIKKQLLIAADIADKYGKSIAVGHLGVKDSETTVKVISEMIPVLEEKGIEIVFVSELFE